MAQSQKSPGPALAEKTVPSRTFSRKEAAPAASASGTTPRDAATLDVICAGMYRACSTWQYTVAAHLVEHARGGKRLGYLGGEQYADLRRPSEGPRGWTVFKSHDGDRFFARALAKRQALVLYAYRDVRDVIFSLMHKRGLTFDQILRQGMIHQVLLNDRFWTSREGVLIQKYEDLVADPAMGVIQIAAHLGIPIEPDEAARIAEEYSVASNRARIESLRNELRESGVDLNDASNQQICDPTTLLHWNHLRPARSETWRDLATIEQRRILERFFGAWLQAHGYPRDPEGFRASLSHFSSIHEELNTLRGWGACRLHAATLSYPRLARLARKVVGLGGSKDAGAVAWQDPAKAG